jgi:hypothetical protein
MVGIAAGAGLIGGATGHFLAGSSAKSTARGKSSADSESASSPEQSQTPDNVSQRIERLEREVSLLKRERQIARALAQNAADGGTGTSSGATIDDPLFETAVLDVIERSQTERRNQRIQSASERWGNELSQKLGLREDQKRKVIEIVRAQLEAMARMRDGEGDAGAGFGRDQWRQRMRAEREKMDTQLASVLTPAQVAQMKDLREQGELPGLWGGGRRRRD